MEFKIGDIVRCIDHDSNVDFGDIGVVVKVDICISVVWEKFKSGHDFKDNFYGIIEDERIVCPVGHGWRMHREQIVHADLTCEEYENVMYSLVRQGFYHPSMPTRFKTEKRNKDFWKDFTITAEPNTITAERLSDAINDVLIKHGAKPIKKENDNMSKDEINFTFTKGERTAIVTDIIEHKNSKNKTILEKKTREVKIPTITTTAHTFNGIFSTTCDEEDFNERTGCLVASAKLIASKSEETNLMYQIAIKTWGTDMSTIILETLADRAVAGDFNKKYNKWKKIDIAYDKEQRTCKVCGKLYESAEEARACEAAHEQRKIDKLNKYKEHKRILKEARLRLEKEEHENKIKEAMNVLSKGDSK